MAEFDSQWVGDSTYGRHIKLTVWESNVEPANNRSKVNWKIEVLGHYYGSTWVSSKVYLKINGSVQADYTTWYDPPNEYFPMGQGTSKTGALWVTHGSDGKKTVTIQYDVAILNATMQSRGGNFTLTNIDRTAPTCSSITGSATSTSSLTVSATFNTTCDSWDYSLDNGAWTNFSTTSATSASKTITGLTSALHTVKVRARKKTNQITGESSNVTVDLIAPTVDFSVTDVGVDGVTISASSNNISCNKWDYSLDDGANWNEFSSTEGTNASATITGLSVNTTYNISVRAKKSSNNLFGYAPVQTVTTLGNSKINSVMTYYPDSTSTTIRFNWTVYVASYHHKLVIKNGNTNILTYDDITGPVSTSDYVLTITSAQRASLLNLIPSNSKTKNITLELTTYTSYSGGSYGAQIGPVSTETLILGTTQENSGPTLSATVVDINNVTIALTGDNSKLIRNASTARCTLSATARNNATLSIQTINNLSTTSRDYVNVDVSSFVFYIKDSRGYEVSITRAPTIIEYSTPTIVATTSRVSPVSSNMIYLPVSGRFFNGSFGLSSISLTIEYCYKEASAQTYESYVAIPGTSITKSSTSYTTNAGYTTPALFDYTKTYNIRIRVSDSIHNVTNGNAIILDLVIIKGDPVFDWGENDFEFHVSVKAPTVSIGNGGFSNIEITESLLIDDVDYTITSTEYAELAGILADPYDQTADYYVGQFCTYNSKIWECNTAITGGESWDANHWTEVTE